MRALRVMFLFYVMIRVPAGILVAASKFSKYNHAAACMFPCDIPEFPGWFTPRDGNMENITATNMRPYTDTELAEYGVQPVIPVRSL